MKKYKVIPVNGAYPFVIARYFDSRKEAQEYVNGYNTKKPIDPRLRRKFVGAVNIEMHHSALTRGYLGVNDAWRGQYSGRFGVGYIEHTPTRDSNCSNSYHKITYYVETK